MMDDATNKGIYQKLTKYQKTYLKNPQNMSSLPLRLPAAITTPPNRF
jgi:hypothetical protein